MTPARVVIVGGGVIGLATALAIRASQPGASITILEKEADWGFHQSGHNSGVIHSGVYYTPGSLKATLCRAGNRSMVEFCRTHGLRHEVCGKLIVAVDRAELGRLQRLYERGVANGLKLERLGPDGIREREPHVVGVEAISVATTAIADFREVCATMARLLSADGADLRLNATVLDVRESDGAFVVETSGGPVWADVVVACAGLQSDRLAARCGMRPEVRIVPFRGEYYDLRPTRRHLVSGLVYPVPDPRFPFLGVHFTRMVDGSVRVGPNAVVGLKREGYRRSDVHAGDAWDVFTYAGFWRLVGKNLGATAGELGRTLSRTALARSLRRLVPEITAADLTPAGAGVRAQAVRRDGTLVDDFLILQRRGVVHVCNAPSPAATASLELGRYIASQVAQVAA